MKYLTSIFLFFSVLIQVNLLANNNSLILDLEKDTVEINETAITSFLEIIEDNIVLSWKIKTNNNCKGFEIERSNNKKDWSNVGFVKYNRNLRNYEFVDNPKLSKSTYYRIKQVNDNSSLVSKRIIAELENIVEGLAFSMSSNPVGNYLMMNNSQGVITIYNAKSELIKQFRVQEESIAIDTSDLTQGQYIFYLERDDATTVSRLIIKN